mgnify:FL=1
MIILNKTFWNLLNNYKYINMTKETKKAISNFISNVSNRDYSKASKALSDVIDRKMEQKILNNNIKIF